MKILIPDNPPLKLNTKTQWGVIKAILLTGGERYYHMIDKYGGVAMMPAAVVEPTIKDKKRVYGNLRR